MASITITNETTTEWLLVTFGAIYGNWSTEPGNVPASTDNSPGSVTFKLDAAVDSTAGVDGYVEYALNADEGPWARIDFRSILTNVNELNVVITDESYEPRSDFNEEGALVGQITFALKEPSQEAVGN
ncbi:hypothetical protein AGABI2DRAFT_138097 [Agaricus bisporus var. bisporus H97]|uniref:hypothetical protein n=1 Tax=Agaricus bisporus var. bisporus (strain H97 / ATCC MYA-4626 / FGSC 10389) TaxID=936046 RepID=UPI00029F5A04|nr:hypothetical protein AGABI2DRAFT_138097 [Agaricus bisporus var. bisporus H97]EKV44492.1 hypothetical protein AGABI2DRAFT_138097 [Agaricus bisporus var. bisporus H97]